MTSPYRFTLHESPHRHYRVSIDGRPASWTGAGGLRIVSATTFLDHGADALVAWHVRQTLAAAERATKQPELVALIALSPHMPDQVRNAAAARGTAAHKHLAARLTDGDEFAGAEYGHRAAIDAWLQDLRPRAPQGRVERAVGSYELAIAGTYDAQVAQAGLLHRVDLKTGARRGVHFAQLACYEHMALHGGEPASDLLSVVYIDGCGNYSIHSILRNSPEHAAADTHWKAALECYRAVPVLDRALLQGYA